MPQDLSITGKWWSHHPTVSAHKLLTTTICHICLRHQLWGFLHQLVFCWVYVTLTSLPCLSMTYNIFYSLRIIHSQLSSFWEWSTGQGWTPGSRTFLRRLGTTSAMDLSSTLLSRLLTQHYPGSTWSQMLFSWCTMSSTLHSLVKSKTVTQPIIQ